MSLRTLLAATLLLCSSNSHAEYGCQTGFVPVNQAGRHVCVADYNLPSWRSGAQNGSAQRAPAKKWHKTWGAVVMDDAKGIVGVSEGKLKKEDALKDAMQSCVRDGGQQCEVVTAYFNQCVAIAWPSVLGSESITSTSRSEGRAKDLSMKRCRLLGNGAECKLVYAACTDAVLL